MIHTVTPGMYKVLRSMAGLPEKKGAGYELVMVDGVAIIPDDMDWNADLKHAENLGIQRCYALALEVNPAFAPLLLNLMNK